MLSGGVWPKDKIINYIRQSGRRGGTMGGPGGLVRGSIAGFGICLLNGVMMIGGMAGGADGGFL
jgi:hypothetical protein